MSHQLPIYPQPRFTIPDQHHRQPGPPLSNFFTQLPNVDSENFGNLVPPVSATSLSNSTSFQSPREAQLPTSTMLQDVRQMTDTSQLSQILAALPHHQAQLLLAQLQAQVHSNAQTSSTMTGSYPVALHPQQSASLPSNLLQPTAMPPTTNPADQGPHAASVAPTIFSCTEEASVPVIPSAKSLGKRRQRSDSITEGQPTKKKANGKAKSMPTKAVQSSSSSSSSENIPPPDGSGGANPLVATAAGQVQVPKGPQKKRPQTRRKSKAAISQPTEASGSGLSSMQTVFRATGATFQPQNFSFPLAQAQYTLPNEQQQPPSHLPSGTVIAANEQPQVQTNGSQWTFPQGSQQPNSVLADPPIALEMDESAAHRLVLAVEEIRKTGNLLAFRQRQLLCYKPVQNMLEAILVSAIQARWVVRRPHPHRSLHFGPPSPAKTAENVLDDENMPRCTIPSNVQTIATQGQMIPQTIGGEGSSTPGIQSAADGSYTYNLAPQSDANSNQIPYHTEANSSRQIPHLTQPNNFEPLDDGEHSVGQPFFESGTAQAGVEAQLVNGQNYNLNEGPSDVSATAQPQPTALPDSTYDLLSLARDDLLPQGMMTNIAQMSSSSHAVTPDSTDPLNHVGSDVFLNIDGSEGWHQAAATADQSSRIPRASNGIISATGESTVLDVARSIGNSHGEPNLSDCGAIQGPTSNSDAQTSQSESPVPAFKDAVSFNRALYGGYESGSATLPFHMLGDHPDIMHTLTPMMGQQEGVFEEQAREGGFDMSQFLDFDLEN